MYMAFCVNCGTELVDGANYCWNCGMAISAVNSGAQRRTVFEGELHKCPNCGELLNAFEASCPACGYELRGSRAANAVRELSTKLEAIEKSREQSKSHSLIGKLYGSDGQIGKTDEQKISLIRSFSIPNTKEDIFEFMILASSNIDAKLYGITNYSIMTVSQREVSDAWYAKFGQAYEKAKISLGNTEDFSRITDIYKKTHKRIQREKLKLPMIFISMFGALMIMLLLIALLPESSPESKIDARNHHLNNVVEQIEDDISHGRFTDARNKAYTLTFDSNLSTEQATYWEKRQQEILIQIEQASSGEYGTSTSETADVA